MQLVHIYLNFPGTTAEAFRYYENVFGTRIVASQTFGEMPFAQGGPSPRRGRSCTRSCPLRRPSG